MGVLLVESGKLNPLRSMKEPHGQRRFEGAKSEACGAIEVFERLGATTRRLLGDN